MNADIASESNRFLDATAPGAQAGVGRELARARERSGLSLHDVSVRTKIALPLLQQIERDDFAMVPEGIYARGMLRAIAREVGCDAESIVRRFVQQHPADLPTFASPSPLPRNSNPDPIAGRVHAAEIDSLDRRRTRMQRLITVLVLLLGGALSTALSSDGEQAWSWIKTMSARAEQAVPVTILAGTPVAAAMIPATAPVITAGVPAAAIEAAEVTGVPIAVSTSGESTQLRIGLRADAPCWVSAMADGERVLYRGLGAGEQVDVQAAAAVVLRIGDPAAVHLTINGAAARLPGQPGEAVTVHLTPDNYRQFVEP